MMKVLKINPQVYDDLLDIKNYISEDSPEQAVKVVGRILDDMERLKEFPDSGERLSNRISFEVKYRYIITYSYATIYYVEDDEVIVTTVLHLARDFSSIKWKD
jgi:plasmid stabilization system protein ParE